MTTIQRIQSLHSSLNRIAPEAACTLHAGRERDWFDWIHFREDQPFTEADLVVVVNYRRKLIAQGSQFPACLRFSYLIGRPDAFEEDLSMAKAAPKPKTDKERVLEMSGRPARPETEPKLARPLFLEALAKLRQSIK